MELIPIVAILSSFSTVVLVVYFVTKARQRRVEAQVQMQSKLIERFGTAPELVSFLHSPAGHEFISGVQSAPEVLMRERIASGFSRGIILSCLGLAFVVLAFAYDEDWSIPAAVVLSVGVGYFLATWTSFRLAEKFRADHKESMHP